MLTRKEVTMMHASRATIKDMVDRTIMINNSCVEGVHCVSVGRGAASSSISVTTTFFRSFSWLSLFVDTSIDMVKDARNDSVS